METAGYAPLRKKRRGGKWLKRRADLTEQANDKMWVLATKASLLMKMIANNLDESDLTTREKEIVKELNQINEDNKPKELKRLQLEIFKM
ncbi:hypothetical protein ACFQ21_12835 [Ohtaekwangia kribbensis]|uniref:Uncharacterized protein n=1 Tax=Ohtaekwangia kribbensis TaxID=688913 RepID=A0ABW3K408_9BACT